MNTGKLFACLIISFIIQASFFICVAYAQNDIALNAESSSFDYFGDSYVIQTKGESVRVEFETPVCISGYLELWLYSVESSEVRISLYSENTTGEENAFFLDACVARKISLLANYLDHIKGISFDSISDFLIVGGISLSDSASDGESYYVEPLDVTVEEIESEGYVDFYFYPRSAYGIRMVDVSSNGKILCENSRIRAYLEDEEYTINIRVEDKAQRVKSIILPVTKRKSLNTDFNLSGGTLSGYSEELCFFGGGKYYMLASKKDYGSSFFICHFGDGEVRLICGSKSLELEKGLNYRLTVDRSEVEIVSDSSFDFIISDFILLETKAFSYYIESDPFKYIDFEFPYLTPPHITETGIHNLDPIESSRGAISISYLYDGESEDGNLLRGEKEGEYLVEYKLINEEITAHFTFEYNLSDTTPPEVSFDFPSVLEYGSEFDFTKIQVDDLSGFDTVIELYDDKGERIICNPSEFNGAVGEYTLCLIVKDRSKSENVTQKSHAFSVMDRTVPEIFEIICVDEIEVNGSVSVEARAHDLSEYYFETAYVLDNIPTVFQKEFTPSEVGVYEILVRCYDVYDNVSERSVILTVYDQTAPEIILEKELSFDEDNFMSFKGISTSDNYDLFPKIEITATYDGAPLEVIGNGIFYKGLGIYLVTVKATDSEGNYSISEFEIALTEEEVELDEIVEEKENVRESGVFGCSNAVGDATFSFLFLLGVMFFRKK